MGKKRNEVRIVFTTTVVDLVPKFGKSSCCQGITTTLINKLIKSVIDLPKLQQRQRQQVNKHRQKRR